MTSGCDVFSEYIKKGRKICPSFVFDDQHSFEHEKYHIFLRFRHKNSWFISYVEPKTFKSLLSNSQKLFNEPLSNCRKNDMGVHIILLAYRQLPYSKNVKYFEWSHSSTQHHCEHCFNDRVFWWVFYFQAALE